MGTGMGNDGWSIDGVVGLSQRWRLYHGRLSGHQSCPNLPPVPFRFVGDGDSIGDSIDDDDDDGDGLSQMETS